jgi:hypothetical protein
MARGSSQRRKQSAVDKERAKKPQNGQPKSMVIRIGAQEVGSSVSQLVQDVRHVMEPDTAVRLKVMTSYIVALACTNSAGRNEEPTNFATTPPWPVLSASPISSSSRAQNPATQTYVWRAHLAVPHFTSASKTIRYAKIFSSPCDTRALAQTISRSHHSSS